MFHIFVIIFFVAAPILSLTVVVMSNFTPADFSRLLTDVICYAGLLSIVLFFVALIGMIFCDNFFANTGKILVTKFAVSCIILALVDLIFMHLFEFDQEEKLHNTLKDVFLILMSSSVTLLTVAGLCFLIGF